MSTLGRSQIFALLFILTPCASYSECGLDSDGIGPQISVHLGKPIEAPNSWGNRGIFHAESKQVPGQRLVAKIPVFQSDFAIIAGMTRQVSQLLKDLQGDFYLGWTEILRADQPNKAIVVAWSDGIVSTTDEVLPLVRRRTMEEVERKIHRLLDADILPFDFQVMVRSDGSTLVIDPDRFASRQLIEKNPSVRREFRHGDTVRQEVSRFVSNLKKPNRDFIWSHSTYLKLPPDFQRRTDRLAEAVIAKANQLMGNWANLESVFLSDIEGTHFGVIGIGGSSDGLQAAQVSALLRQHGKEIEFVGSVRSSREIKGAQSFGGGIYKLNAESIYYRNFESPFSNEFATYLLTSPPDSLALSFSTLHRLYPKLDALIFVDSDGDVFDFSHWNEIDDIHVLNAAAGIGLRKYVFVVPGINIIPATKKILASTGAKTYLPTVDDGALIAANYLKWGMSVQSSNLFAFTPFVWQQALAGHFGAPDFLARFGQTNQNGFEVKPDHANLIILDYESLMRLRTP